MYIFPSCLQRKQLSLGKASRIARWRLWVRSKLSDRNIYCSFIAFIFVFEKEKALIRFMDQSLFIIREELP
jgi:hypothetical protein